MATHSSLHAGQKSHHGQKRLAGYSLLGRKRIGHDLATSTRVTLKSLIKNSKVAQAKEQTRFHMGIKCRMTSYTQ